MAKLVVRKGRNIGQEHKLNSDRLVMGRRSACPIPILDPKSSREHAAIVRKNDLIFLQDLSRNGTFVNGKVAAKNGDGLTPLKFGDQIKIGDTILEVVDEKNEPISIEIPGYKILEKVGVGGMGTVYKAKQLSMDRIVALKVLNERYSTDREFVDRFIREARAAGKLNHPNVIHVHDVSKANGRHYFSMEYIDGSSVKEMLRIDGKVLVDKAVDIVIQTAKALEFAHENGIVHRDIKPDNIMLTKDGVVKIADLGIAKTFEETGLSAKDNRRVMGTPHYMAPEQALGKEIDHRVDIYSLGATFYHMLTGTTPFSGSTAHEVLKAHIQESLPPIQEFTQLVPDPVCFIIERMMAKLPEKRYPNMTRLIEDLERSQKGIGEGIERIAAGESTVMRAMSAKEAAVAAKKRRVPEGTESVSTGVVSPVKNVLFYAGLVILFLLVVGIVVHFAKPGGTGPVPPPPPPVPTPVSSSGATSSSGAPENPQNAEAEKKLANAKALLANDPLSAPATAELKAILDAFPTSTTADEAKKLLDGILASRKEADRRKIMALADEARKLEAAGKDDPAKLAEIAKKWREVMAAAGGIAPDIEKEAQGKAEGYEQKVAGEAERNTAAALQQADADSKAGVAQKDFDAARKPWADFLAKFGATTHKADGEQKLNAVNALADTTFKDATDEAQRKEQDKNEPIPLALAAWDDYLAKVKDSKHKGEAENAKKALEQRATTYVQEEGKKVGEKVKAFDFDGAIQIVKTVQMRLNGMQGHVALAKVREADLAMQKSLHDKVLKAINEQAKPNAPIPIKDKLEVPKMAEVEKWAVQSATPALLQLVSVSPPGPGVGRKFADMKPAEVYQIYLQFLGDLAADDHKSLAAYCRERGLNDEAQVHEQKAQGK
ncbi:MAG: protein kinase [Planctomycetes bacterium]|nr:protein kinase [Planctomycetota bacterium]